MHTPRIWGWCWWVQPLDVTLGSDDGKGGLQLLLLFTGMPLLCNISPWNCDTSFPLPPNEIEQVNPMQLLKLTLWTIQINFAPLLQPLQMSVFTLISHLLLYHTNPSISMRLFCFLFLALFLFSVITVSGASAALSTSLLVAIKTTSRMLNVKVLLSLFLNVDSGKSTSKF